MTHGVFISYLRCSTQRQSASGLGLEAQREAVARYLSGDNRKLVAEVVEVESGKRNDRPKLAEALRLCRLHKATLVVAKLDRLARNVSFVSALMESGVDFVAVDFPQANRLTVHILAAVAEHEAKACSDRTKAALAACRARGVVLGGFRGATISAEARLLAKEAVARRVAARHSDLLPVIEEIKTAGITSLCGIARALSDRGIPASRGGLTWAPAQVARILASNNG